MPTSKRADLSKVLPAVRCTARKQNGEPCRAMAARGATVCRVHGGSAPQVKAAAKRRLDQAADALVQRLLGFALDGQAPDAVALTAIRDALDRAGLTAKQLVEVGVDPAPWEAIMTDIAGIATIGRAESRTARGLPALETPELPAAPADITEVVDADIVAISGDRPAIAAHSRTEAQTRCEPTDYPSGEWHPSGGPSTPQPALLTMEEAVTETRVRHVRRTTRRYR